MNEHDKSISQARDKVHGEFQSLSTNVKIAESVEATEKARQAIIELRIRRRKRTVIIK